MVPFLALGKGPLGGLELGEIDGDADPAGDGAVLPLHGRDGHENGKGFALAVIAYGFDVPATTLPEGHR